MSDQTKSDSTADYVATMLAGASGGCFARTFTYPIDTCKARIQCRKTDANITRVLRNEVNAIVSQEGIRGFYRGFSFAFAGSIPAGMLYFTCYEKARDSMKAWGLQSAALTSLTAGFLAEAMSCVMWVPLDVLKERMQTQAIMSGKMPSAIPSARPPPQELYTSSVKFARDIWRTEGLAGLYKGYGATLFSFGPFSALYFLFYESAKDFGLALEGVSEEKDLKYPTAVFGGSGVVAGATAAFLTNPLDVVKVRVQVERRGGSIYGYRGILHGLKKIFASEGALRGLFTGAGTRMLFQAPTTAIGFATFEHFKLFYSNLLGS